MISEVRVCWKDFYKYQDSNALAICFEHVDIKWYHLLPTPLEFERMVNHLVLLVLFSTQTRNQK